MPQQKRLLSPADALKWIPNWSDSDRLVIREQVDRLNIVEFAQVPSGGYLNGFNPASEVVVRLSPGYLDFAPGYGPRHARPYKGLRNMREGWTSLTFTTFRPREGTWDL